MNAINVIEFFSHFDVNPYVYISVLIGVVVGIFLIWAMIYAMVLKNAFVRMTTFDKSVLSVRARLISIEIAKGEKAKAFFEDENGEEYTLIVSKINTAFLTIHDEGELSFRGDKFVSFKRVD